MPGWTRNWNTARIFSFALAVLSCLCAAPARAAAPAPACMSVAAYRSLQQALVRRAPEKVDPAAAKCLIPEPRRYREFAAHLQAAAVLRDSRWRRWTRQAACRLGFECVDDWREAYRIFNLHAAHFAVALEYLRKGLPANLRKAAARPDARGSLLAWQGASLAAGAVELLRRTESPELAGLLAKYFDGVLALRDSVLNEPDPLRGRPLAAWSSTVRPENVRTAHAPLAGRIVFPMLSFADIALRSERLAAFHARARIYLAEGARAIREFDTDWREVDGGRRHYYVMPTRGTVEPLNHAHAVGNALLLLYKYTGDAAYKDKIAAMVTVFQDSAEQEPNGSLRWPYYPAWFQAGQHSEPMWKGAVTAPFLYRAYEAGFLDADTARRLRLTFLRNVLGDGGLNGRVSSVDARPIDAATEAGRAQQVFAWLEMFSDAAVPAFADVMTDHPGLFPRGWLSSGKTFLVYARMIAAGDPAAPPPPPPGFAGLPELGPRRPGPPPEAGTRPAQ